MPDVMPSDRRLLLQESPNPVIVYRDGRILWANDTACGILLDPIGSEVISHVLEEDRARIAARVSDIQRGRVDGPARLTITTRQGPRIIESSATLIELPDGPAVQTTWRDLTDLERMRTWLESVAGSTSDLFAIVSLDGEIQYLNQALLEFRGEDRRTGLPDGRNLLDHVAPGQESAVAEATEALDRDGRWRGELELLTGGATAAVSFLLQRHRVAGETFVSAIGRDVSAQRDLRIELERAVRDRDTFGARVAHELKNPLTGVVGMTSLLAETDLDEAQRELVGLIATSASDLQRVVDDLAAFSMSGRPDVDVATSLVDLRHEVEQVVLPIAESAESSFRIQGAARSLADPNRVRQIVRNLCINAVRYGGRRVAVELVEVGDRAFVSVIDDGTGVPPEAAEWIFGEFRTAHDPHASGGMGLGLAVARQLARRMGGDLTYRRDGGDTVFTLELPAGRAS